MTSPRALAIALTLCVALPAHAGALPALDRRVVDEAGALAPAARERLESELAGYEQRTGHQFAVLILKGLDGDVLEQLSLRAAEEWRLGDARRDDGLLVVLAMKERAVRVEVGYGLEGIVTDALSSRVIRETMTPRFARGDIAGGLTAGLEVLMKAAAGESTGAGASGAGSTVQRSPSWTSVVPMLVVVLLVFATGVARRRGHVGRHGTATGRGTGARGLWPLLFLASVLGGGGRGGGGGFGGGGGGFGGGGASGRW